MSLNQDSTPVPSDIALLQKSKILELHYESGEVVRVSVAKLRAHSPSAENSSVTKNTSISASVENDLNIQRMEPVGHYGLRIHFTDGHTSGIYTWSFLRELAEVEINSKA